MKYWKTENNRICGFLEIPDEYEQPSQKYIDSEGLVAYTGTMVAEDIMNHRYVWVIDEKTLQPKRTAEFAEQETPDLTWNRQARRWEDRRPEDERRAWVAEKIRERRTKLLRDSDWTQVDDSPLPVAKREQWRQYRQQLRDLPALYEEEGNFDAVVFPDPPSD